MTRLTTEYVTTCGHNTIDTKPIWPSANAIAQQDYDLAVAGGRKIVELGRACVACEMRAHAARINGR